MSIDVARSLLARARDDAEAVRATLDIGAVTDAIVGFHLTPYAVRHRYGADPPALVDRETALRLSAAAVTWATAQLDRA